MNVLILTPDAVGSTLLQRLLTIYMQFHKFDQPVINLHELTNGIAKFYSSEFNRELLSRRGKWGYYQSLPEVVDLLESVDHYKTARLAQYHIQHRQDSIADQLPFYQYLNDNFFIIACRRENLFEHALSHAFNAVTKKLNVYNPLEKIDSFYRLYRSGVEIQAEQIYSALDRYRDYLAWVDCYFSVGSYFVYEKQLPQIEKYILGLPVFGEQNALLSWEENFNIDFKNWNLCHYYNSDIGSLALGNSNELLRLENQSTAQLDKSNAVSLLQSALPPAHQSFLNTHNSQYAQVQQSIDTMQSLGILPTGVPIKKQTLAEKMHIIRNLDQCVEAFNHWVDNNPGITAPVTAEEMHQQAQDEYAQLWDSSKLSISAPQQQQSILR